MRHHGSLLIGIAELWCSPSAGMETLVSKRPTESPPGSPEPGQKWADSSIGWYVLTALTSGSGWRGRVQGMGQPEIAQSHLPPPPCPTQGGVTFSPTPDRQLYLVAVKESTHSCVSA